jgi:hypothetical protein
MENDCDWRDLEGELAPEHVAMLRALEAKLFTDGIPADEIRHQLFEQAQEFAAFAASARFFADVPTPTGAGRFKPFHLTDEGWTRDFEGREFMLGDFRLQIVGTQKDDRTTTRRLSISREGELTAQEARDLAGAILGEAKHMEELDEADNSQ